MILRRIQQQSVHRPPPFSRPRRRHRHQRIIPAPGVRPIPVYPHPVQRVPHRVPVHPRPRHETQRPQHRRMIRVPLRIRVAVRRRLRKEILPPRHRRCRQPLQHRIPMRLARQPQPPPPRLRRFQPPPPVGQLERRIQGALFRKNLLRTLQHRPQHIPPRLRLPRRIARHEIRRLENHLPVSLQRRPVGLRPPAELRVKNRMRLLPDQKRPDWRRRFLPRRPRHLRPPRPRITLPPGRRLRLRQNLPVISQAPLQQRYPPPQRKMRLMPPVHFQVKLPLPRIVRQPRLRRRKFPRTLDRRQVLRQHNPPLQLKPPRITAARQIHRPARPPKFFPMPRPRPLHRREFRCRRQWVPLRRKFAHQFQCLRPPLRP